MSPGMWDLIILMTLQCVLLRYSNALKYNPRPPRMFSSRHRRPHKRQTAYEKNTHKSEREELKKSSKLKRRRGQAREEKDGGGGGQEQKEQQHNSILPEEGRARFATIYYLFLEGGASFQEERLFLWERDSPRGAVLRPKKTSLLWKASYCTDSGRRGWFPPK